MGRMTTEPTYDRPVAATMIVRLANGEGFEAQAEDFSKFGFVDRNTVLADWRAFVEDAIGTGQCGCRVLAQAAVQFLDVRFSVAWSRRSMKRDCAGLGGGPARAGSAQSLR